MKKVLALAAVLAVIGGGAALLYAASAPEPLHAETVKALPQGDAARGEMVFWAGGCTSCHAQKEAKGDDRLKLGGGRVLKSDFGDFVVPNISPDEADGIGDWSLGDFAGAMLKGVSPDGRHLYPSFPYTSYARMSDQDIADLWAFLKTLPPVSGKTAAHDLSFPFNIRRGVGLWKLAFFDPSPVVDLPNADETVRRGQYLVEGPGHCGECHTPRNFAGGPETGRWLGGAKAPEGDGKVPDITPGKGGIGSWSQSDISYYLESGFTPEFDSVGGAMVEVQENMAKLPSSDRDAIAAYLKEIPPVDSAK